MTFWRFWGGSYSLPICNVSLPPVLLTSCFSLLSIYFQSSFISLIKVIFTLISEFEFTGQGFRQVGFLYKRSLAWIPEPESKSQIARLLSFILLTSSNYHSDTDPYCVSCSFVISSFVAVCSRYVFKPHQSIFYYFISGDAANCRPTQPCIRRASPALPGEDPDPGRRDGHDDPEKTLGGGGL